MEIESACLHVIQHKTAKSIGIRFYLNGRPCHNGNYCLRRTSNKACTCSQCKAKDCERSTRYVNANKDHVKKRQKKHYLQNRERITAGLREYYRKNSEYWINRAKEYRSDEANKAKIKKRARAFRIRHKDKIREQMRRWIEENPEKKAEIDLKRRLSKRQRTPVWFSDLDKFVVSEAISLCKDREELTGIPHHVDHMIPLAATKASGLHCYQNIQVLPAYINLAKNNDMILTKHFEWAGRLEEMYG